MASAVVENGSALGRAPVALGRDRTAIPEHLLRYILTTSWRHQIALVALSVAVFLLEVVPLEIQRRVVNDIVKHRPFSAIVLLGVAYVTSVIVQGGIKLGMNLYRSWVGERATRDLRTRCYAMGALDRPETQGTAVAVIVSEVEPVGGFIGSSISEPLLQSGILATVIAYLIHLDPWMGAVALLLFVPQLVFVPLMQHAVNRSAGMRVWLLRQIGAAIIGKSPTLQDPESMAPIDGVFRQNMRIFGLKFSMNFLMNLCSHLQVVAALLLGAWWVLQGQLEIGGVIAFISGIGRLNDPWGDLVNYFREVSVNTVKYRLIADALNPPDLPPNRSRQLATG